MYAKNSVFHAYLLEIVEQKTKETFVLLNDEVTEAWYLPLVLLFI